ncbi:hypothetical protein [Streptomyces ehimensis]|uniref:hypothetical protein n=1 Tax=Streptomyces ehimensis TaxID=68195 RepID=UPI003AAD8456
MSSIFAVTLTGCGLVQDDSLEDVLKAFDLQLPSCEIESKKYSGSALRSDEELKLSFRAPKGCIEQFLQSHGENPADSFRWPFGGGTVNGEELSPTRPPFPDSTMNDMGWKLDPSRVYNCYLGFRTSNGGAFQVVVDPKGDKNTIYMVSTERPKRHG